MECGRGIACMVETCPMQGGLPESGTQAGGRDEQMLG